MWACDEVPGSLKETVILSEAKDLLSCPIKESRSFASLRMTVLAMINP
jgi:hypothetical protein